MPELADHVDGLLHEPTQVHDGVVDLTAAEIREVSTPGRVDFGGGELEPAEQDPVPAEKRNPDDDYGWWHLDAGQYLVAFNESLSPPSGGRIRLQPRDELLARGANHPTVAVTDADPLPLAVGGAGIRLKENARVATAVELVE
jgi:hypothetical protein